MVAVLEHRIGAEFEFQRGVVDVFPRRGQQRLEREGVGIAPDQPIPRLMRQHEAVARRVVVGVGVDDAITPGDAQRVGGFMRPSGGGREGEQHKRG